MYKIGFLSGGSFKIQPKIICGKFRKIPENCQNSEMQTIQPEIPEILGGKLHGMEIPG